jgi:hypothetical protein
MVPQLGKFSMMLSFWVEESAQTDRPRFLLPFDHHLRKINEAPISACDPADGLRRNPGSESEPSATFGTVGSPNEFWNIGRPTKPTAELHLAPRQ